MNGFKTLTVLLLLFLIPQCVGAHELAPAEKQAILNGSHSVYLWLGAKHMLTGVEHILFIFGMVFLLKRYLDVLKYVTTFTIAHSITLGWATYYGVSINYILVEAFIAMSVLYIAMANLDTFRKLFRVPTPNMFISVIIFGLVHGLGLSERLQEFPMTGEHIVINTLLFNVGVEFGQIVVLSCILLWLSLFRKSHSFEFFRKISNYGLIAMSVLLFFIQVNYYHDHQLTASMNIQMHTNSVFMAE